jgi:ribonuclease P protein component
MEPEGAAPTDLREKASEHEGAATDVPGEAQVSEPIEPAKERALGERLPRRLRLQRRREFLRVQRSGVKHHTRYFLVFVAPSPSQGRAPQAPAAPPPSGPAPRSADASAGVSAGGLPGTRLGVTVTRKVGKAVKRNRIKRLIREAFRREHHALPAGLDVVFVAKRDAVDTTLEAVVLDVRALAQRLRAPQGRAGTRPGPAGPRGRGRGTPPPSSAARSR